MKLKISLDSKPRHNDFATAITWVSGGECVLSCGDDHEVVEWDVTSGQTTPLLTLPHSLYPTSLSAPPRSMATTTTGVHGNQRVSKAAAELLLLTATDGHFHLLSRAGRIEKSVLAHKGAVLGGCWSGEGSELLTWGEDGAVRVWSRAGMLRTTLAQVQTPVHAGCWSPDGSSVLYSVGGQLVIRPFVVGAKQLQWKAHDGLILALAWAPSHALILSGAEDSKYKLWDSEARPLFSSSPLNQSPITSVCWSRGGDLFAVGGFNSVRVCDRFGWSVAMEKPKIGSVYALAWAGDGTQLVGASASGHVFLGSVVEATITWGSTEASLVDRKTIRVTELSGSGASETVELREKVVRVGLGFGHLLALTPTQVHVYSIRNLNTPVIAELRENNSISLVLQTNWQFALCGNLSISVWTYDGRQIGTIRWSGMRCELLSSALASMAPDMVAIRDGADTKLIRIFEAIGGKPSAEIRIASEVRSLSLAKGEGPPGSGTMAERLLAALDKNGDLYLVQIRKYGLQAPPKKLASMVQSLCWHDEAPILAIIQEGKLVVHYLPQILFLDPTLIEFTLENKEVGDLGRYPEIVSYESNKISIRRSDGMLFVTSGSTIVPHLYEYAANGKFSQAKRICRYINDKLLWGVMAGLSTWKSELSLMEICYSEIAQNEKVYFINELKEHTPDPFDQKAQLTLICQGAAETEAVLIQQGKIGEAIQTHVNAHNWNRALDLAMKHKQGLDMVLGARKFYLHLIGQEESMVKFIELRSLTYVPDITTSSSKKKKKSSTRKNRGESKGASGDGEDNNTNTTTAGEETRTTTGGSILDNKNFEDDQDIFDFNKESNSLIID